MAHRLRALALACLAAAAGPGCTPPCREGSGPAERREFERDHERCEDQARKLAGNVDVGDYRACMRVRGWCAAPER